MAIDASKLTEWPQRRRFLALLGAALATPTAVSAHALAPTTLFAAASTTEAVTAVAATFAATGHSTLRPVFAASSTLAQQIVRGAPADLYLSANGAWMDFLAARGAIDAESRIDLLSNRLVLIAPAESPLSLSIAPGFDLAGALGDRRLAMGEPSHVPAGTYAKTALQTLGVWPQIEPKAAYMADVRAALALVERREAAAGIVYATDAAASRKVRIVDTFPADSHPPITYPLAIIAGRRNPDTIELYEYLRSADAQAIFRAHGFVPAAGGA
jgi:molybdate transport system substrate-binding protein